MGRRNEAGAGEEETERAYGGREGEGRGDERCEDTHKGDQTESKTKGWSLQQDNHSKKCKDKAVQHHSVIFQRKIGCLGQDLNP